MVLESFGRAPMKAKVLNLVVLFSSFCAFVGCCVAFGGDLFRAKVETSSGPFEWYFYQSAVQTEANRVYYSNGAFCVWSFCDQCSSGGKGFLALMVLSFVLLLFLMVVTVFRVMGGVAISAIAHPARSILVESWMTTAATLLYFIGVVVYGSTCYRAVQNTPAFTVTISGFAFTIFSFFFLFTNLILFHFIRVDPACHLGWMHPVGGAGWSGLNEEFVAEEERHVDYAGGRPPVGYGDDDTAEHSGAYQQGGSTSGAPPAEAIRTKASRAQY